MSALRRRYPVMIRLLRNACRNWVNNTLELIERYNKDAALIAQGIGYIDSELGQIAQIKLGLSDRHCNGKTVAVIKTTNGVRIVYKPRPGSCEVLLLKWLRRFCPKHCDLVANTIDCGVYCWQPFIDARRPRSSSEEKLLLVNYGRLLALTYLFKVGDCHAENVRINGSIPVLLDAEVLGQRPLKILQTRTSYSNIHERSFTVLDTLLLPMPCETPDCATALGNLYESKRHYIVRQWLNVGKLSLRLVKRNLTRSDRYPATPPSKIAYFIRKGFISLLSAFMDARRSDINRFSREIWVGRAVVRNTVGYSHLLNRSLLPSYLGNEISFRRSFYLLSNIFSLDKLTPAGWAILNAEIAAMLRLDIPYFHFRSNVTNVSYDRSRIVKNAFRYPSPALALKHHQAGARADVALQEKLIALSIDLYLPRTRRKIRRTFSKEREQEPLPIIETLNLLLENICSTAVCISGETHFVGISNALHENKRRVAILDDGLYSGRIGVCLALANSLGIDGAFNVKKLLKNASRLICLRAHGAPTHMWARYGIGGYIGAASLAYGLHRIGAALADDYYCRAAIKLLKQLNPKSAIRENSDDVISGVSGLLLVLCSAHRWTSDGLLADAADYLAMATCKRISQRLKNPRISKKSSRDQRMLAGYAHGLAGYAHALLEVWEITRSNSLLEGAMLCFEHEDRLLDTRIRNWRDCRDRFEKPQGRDMNAWCHGSVGIWLARSRAARILQAHATVPNLPLAERYANEAPRLLGWHLCCGEAGVALALTKASGGMDRQDGNLPEAKRYSDILDPIRGLRLQNLSRTDAIRCQYPLGLMDGIAGAVYYITECIRPSVSNILLLK